MRRVHRPGGRKSCFLLSHSNRSARRTADTHGRRAWDSRPAKSSAGCLSDRAGCAMRLLHRRHDHARAGTAGRKAASDGGRDSLSYGRQSLSLWDTHADSSSDPPSRRSSFNGGLLMRSELLSWSRRDLLAAGGLVVAFSCLSSSRAFSQLAGGGEGGTGPKVVAPDLPGSLKGFPLLDAWIRIDPEGRATVFTGKAELGQGIANALWQVAAEELDLPAARVEIVTADSARTPDEGVTSGSHSMQDSGTAIANAAA